MTDNEKALLLAVALGAVVGYRIATKGGPLFRLEVVHRHRLELEPAREQRTPLWARFAGRIMRPRRADTSAREPGRAGAMNGNGDDGATGSSGAGRPGSHLNGSAHAASA